LRVRASACSLCGVVSWHPANREQLLGVGGLRADRVSREQPGHPIGSCVGGRSRPTFVQFQQAFQGRRDGHRSCPATAAQALDREPSPSSRGRAPAEFGPGGTSPAGLRPLASAAVALAPSPAPLPARPPGSTWPHRRRARQDTRSSLRLPANYGMKLTRLGHRFV
jgi:hypothetical protein